MELSPCPLYYDSMFIDYVYSLESIYVDSTSEYSREFNPEPSLQEVSFIVRITQLQ